MSKEYKEIALPKGAAKVVLSGMNDAVGSKTTGTNKKKSTTKQSGKTKK